MTAHLSPAEFVDFADGALPAARAAHAEACPECRRQATDLAAMMTHASGVEVPEPSPLFWAHLSARVSAAIEAEPARAVSQVESWRVWTVRQILVGAMVAVVALGGVWLARDYRETAVTGQASTLVASSGLGLALESAAPSDLTPWDLLTSMAEDVPVEDVHAAGLTVRSGTLDSAVQDLSQDERNELGRLLQDELKHPSE